MSCMMYTSIDFLSIDVEFVSSVILKFREKQRFLTIFGPEKASFFLDFFEKYQR